MKPIAVNTVVKFFSNHPQHTNRYAASNLIRKTFTVTDNERTGDLKIKIFNQSLQNRFYPLNFFFIKCGY